MSGNIVNFNDGTPQVSILASASAKRMQERRRQSRLFKSAKGMGVGKKYPGVGTHHRNTKHVWLFSELAEVSAAYKEHHTTMPCWKIADMLYYSFGEQLKHNNDHQQANIAEVDQQDQDQPIAQLREPRIHLPSIEAIQAKLMDCITLQHKDTFGYTSQPTQMHTQVWAHLELAKKHHTMLKEMAALPVPVSVSVSVQIKEEQEQDMKLNPLASTWNVHAREFLFETDTEYEATLPPAKRRKVEFVEEEEVQQQQQQQQIKQEQEEQLDYESPEVIAAQVIAFDLNCLAADASANANANATEEFMSLVGGEHALIQKLVANIRQHNDRVGSLVSSVKDSHAEIEQHHQAITRSMEQIESIVATTAAATTAASTTTTAAFDPNHYQCRECTEMFNPLVPGYWLIGPNRETGDTFYLCSKCTSFMEATTPRADAPTSDNDDDQCDDCCGDGDCDCWDDDVDIIDYDSDGLDNQPKQGDYDHSEECS